MNLYSLVFRKGNLRKFMLETLLLKLLILSIIFFEDVISEKETKLINNTNFF